MNVKTIVTIALIGLLGVGTAAGIFLSDHRTREEFMTLISHRYR